MEELTAVWGYMEKAGVASAVIMSIILYWTRKDLKEAQEKYEAAQEARIAEGKDAYGIVESNTRETRTLIDLVRGLRN